MNTGDMMSEFKRYRRKQIAELRPFVPGEILPIRVSVSAPDRGAGSPKLGDMIARNPANHDDQWLVRCEPRRSKPLAGGVLVRHSDIVPMRIVEVSNAKPSR